MKFKKYILIALLLIECATAGAKDYKASFFGIQPGGQVLNTKSIQFAIDHISASGGGRLIFETGKYLSGSIYLKSGVTLHLEEGATLLGSLNPMDYDKKIWMAFIFAYNQQNIGITGKGTIDGQGKYVARNVVEMIEKGLIKDSYKYGRPSEGSRPMMLNFRECKDIFVQGITFRNSACWNQTYDQCKNLVIDSVIVDNVAYWNEDGVDLVDCEDVRVTNCYIDAADDGICLKSHDATKACKNILISNNKIRTSANGIKFGTASRGGFSNIRILNNVVFDTYRSAIALEAVDCGYIENIEIDGLVSQNTGNLIFLRTGKRWGEGKSRMENIRIRNVTADIPAAKPDAAYGYEGPEEDQPRNLSPGIMIMGIPEAMISGVILENITFRHAGGGNIHYANVPLQQLNLIPEIPAKYPDFSMFKELPAWGIFVRHAKNLQFSGISMECEKNDFRMPIVLDNVQQSQFKTLKIKQEGLKKEIYQNRSKGITLL